MLLSHSIKCRKYESGRIYHYLVVKKKVQLVQDNEELEYKK